VNWADIIYYPSLVEQMRVHDATLEELGDYLSGAT